MISLKTIIEAVADKRQLSEVVMFRRAIAYLLRQDGWKLQKIGKIMDKRHDTVIHYIKTHEPLYKQLPFYKRLYDELEPMKVQIINHYENPKQSE